MQSMTIDELQEARGLPVYDSAGDKIGEVEEIFYDEQTNEPVWIGIGTGFFGTKRVLVPVDGAQLEPDGLTVPYDKDKVKDSPDIDSDEISPETEAQLYVYYGLSSYAGVQYTADVDTSQAGTVTRSEEERTVAKERIGLEKDVDTTRETVGGEVRKERVDVKGDAVDR